MSYIRTLKKAEQQNMENLPDDVKDSVAELHKAAQSVTRSYDNAPKKDSSNKDE